MQPYHYRLTAWAGAERTGIALEGCPRYSDRSLRACLPRAPQKTCHNAITTCCERLLHCEAFSHARLDAGEARADSILLLLLFVLVMSLSQI